MLNFLWAWILRSKAAKVGGGVLGGSGLLAFLLNFINGEFNKVNIRIEEKDKAIRQYVDAKHDLVFNEILNVKDGQQDIKKLLIKLDERVYQLNNGGK